MNTSKRAVLLLLCLIFLGAGVYTLISYINEAHDQTAASQAQFGCDHSATPGDDASVEKAIDACVLAGDARDAQINEQTNEFGGGVATWTTCVAILCILASTWSKNRRQRQQLSGQSDPLSQ